VEVGSAWGINWKGVIKEKREDNVEKGKNQTCRLKVSRGAFTIQKAKGTMRGKLRGKKGSTGCRIEDLRDCSS